MLTKPPLYLHNPPDRQPHPRHWKPHRWTGTIEEYLNEANQWTLCLMENRQQGIRYRWLATINVSDYQSANDIQATWNKCCRKLRHHGIVAFWVREITHTNLTHYHLIITNDITQRQLERAIKSSMPLRQALGWRKRVERIDSEWHTIRYILKAKVSGIVNGSPVDDLYAPKRLLFRPNLGIRKCGTIGNLWGDKSKAKIWSEIVAREKRIADGLARPHVIDLCQAVYGMLDGVPLARIERCFGYFADCHAITQWLKNYDNLSD